MTFRVFCTGINNYWGGNGESKLLADSHLIIGLKNHWIKGNVEYLGNSKLNRGNHIPETKVGLPVRKIDVLNQIKMQTKSYERILKELDFINKKRDEIKELLTSSKSSKKVKGK